MVCIMSAMMMMSSVTGTMITPMGAYAVDYENIGQMTADENGKYNLAEGDTLDTNTGTIHENNGIIKDNAEGATVEINNNIIEKNEGTVVTNAVGATVGTENDEVSGTVVNNYGTAEQSSVEKNYGTANNSNVINNYQSGKVTGSGSEVGINYGGYVEEGINIEVNEQAVVPASQTEAAPATVQDDSPKPEENNDQPQPKVKNINDGYVRELVNEIDKELNNSGVHGTIYIYFRDRDNLTVDELRTLLFYTPSNITINCQFITKNSETYGLYIYPRSLQSTIDEKGNGVLATDGESVYHSCLDELSKEDGQLAGPNRIAQIFNHFNIACELYYNAAPDDFKSGDIIGDIKDTSIQLDQLQTAAITNANAAIAPVSNNLYIFDTNAYAASTSNKEVFVPYIYQNEQKWDVATMREIANQSDPGMEELVYDAMKNKKGKWIRYDQNGKMLKGWVTIEGDLAEKYPNQAGYTYYYDTVTGTMARGNIFIDGVRYYFNEITGVLED